MALCRICENTEASKFVHYGVDGICGSCRGFFKRSVQSGFYSYFKCLTTKSKPCVIESKSRKSCKKCRFAKCIDVGMKIAYVLDKEERCKRMVSQYHAGPKANLSQQDFSSDDLGQLENLYKYFMIHLYGNICEVYASNFRIMWEQMRPTFKDQPLTFNQVQESEQMDFFGITKASHHLARHVGLSSDSDIQILTRNSYYKIQAIYNSIYFFSSKSWIDDVREFGLDRSGLLKTDMVDSLSNEIDKMNLTGSDADNNHKGCFTYTNVFSSPWSPDYWSELKHKSVLQELKDWLCQDDKPDCVLLILLSVIFLFNTDGYMIRTQLKDRIIIETLQQRYATLLWKYLKSKTSLDNPSRQFHKALMFDNATQEAFKIAQTRMNV